MPDRCYTVRWIKHLSLYSQVTVHSPAPDAETISTNRRCAQQSIVFSPVQSPWRLGGAKLPEQSIRGIHPPRQKVGATIAAIGPDKIDSTGGFT